MIDSVPLTEIFYQVKDGDEDAVGQLWNACYLRLVVQARKHLQGVSTRMADEEDVALDAIQNFIRAARLGRFQNFKNRDDLWRLLFKITKDRAIDLRRAEARRQIRGESAFLSPFRSDAGIHEVPAETSEDAYHAAISETLEHKLSLLDPELCQYAVARLEGFTNPEIAENFGVSLRTVERKLHRIRRIWKANRDGKPE